MTREEAVEFLANTKVYVNGKSKEIQEKLFSLGFVWNDDTRTVSSLAYPFLFISCGLISRGDCMTAFINNELREVTAEDILNITIDEPKYRPFKDAKECWQEMLNHEPFGWIKSKNENYLNVLESINNAKNYQYIFENYTFADGTPFGIKEE